MSVYRATFVVAAFCAGAAQAQTVPPEAAVPILTLDAAIREADAVAPGSEAAEAGVRSAEAGRGVARLRPNPTLSVETENIAGTGLYRGFDSAETTIGFALPIEMGGKRSARIAVSDAEIIRAQIQRIIAREDLRLAVTQAYVQAVAAERRVKVAESQTGVTVENLRVASDRVMIGANSPIDEQRAKLQNINAETEHEQARRALTAARATLEQYLRRPLIEALDAAWFDRTAGFGPEISPKADGTLALAVAHADLATADARLRLSRSQAVPDVTVSAGTRRLSTSNDQAMIVGVSIPLPLFNRGTANVKQALAERDRFDAQRRLALFEAEQAIVTVRAERDSAAAAIRASGPAQIAATEAVRIARIGYGEGKFEQMVLLDAERTLLDTRRAAIDALATYHHAAARLARLTASARSPAETGN